MDPNENNNFAKQNNKNNVNDKKRKFETNQPVTDKKQNVSEQKN